MRLRRKNKGEYGMKTWKQSTLFGFLAILVLVLTLVACDNGNNGNGSQTHKHDSGTWRTILEPTCMATGTKELRCTSCNELLDTETIPIDDDAHVWEAWDEETVDTPPTCTETGTGKIFCLLNHQHTNTGGIIPALGHNFIDNWSVKKPASCEEDGEKERTCTRYNCNEAETETIDALGHDFKWEINAGSISKRACTRCTEKINGTIGDNGPYGGIIFYVSTTGFTMADNDSISYYLEAAYADMPNELAWSSSEFDTIDISDTAQSIGTGRKNTALILNIDPKAPAAKACNDYGIPNDWFLPSIDELSQLYNQKSLVGISSGTYFSSSQFSTPDGVWVQHFSFDLREGFMKSGAILPVRAIRAF